MIDLFDCGRYHLATVLCCTLLISAVHNSFKRSKTLTGFDQMRAFRDLISAQFSWRLVLLFAVMFFVQNALISSAWARCGLIPHESLNADMATLTGRSPQKLLLMPTMHYVYDQNGVYLAYGKAAIPCDGPQCRQRLPLPNSFGSVCTNCRNHVSAGYVLTSRETADVPVLASNRLALSSTSMFSHDASSPLYRPPIAV